MLQYHKPCFNESTRRAQTSAKANSDPEWGSRFFSKFNGHFLVHKDTAVINIYMKIRSVVFIHKVANGQTDKQKDRRLVKHK